MKKYNLNSAIILYRESYWDERALGIASLDIISIEVEDKRDFILLVENFLKYLNNKYKFVSYRMTTQDSVLKKELIENGFILVEQSYIVECLNPQIQFNSVLKMDVGYLVDSVEDIEQVIKISKEDFHFGRFFEDPFIENSVAQTRNEYWIHDMIDDPTCKILLAKKNNSVIGFMAFKMSENKVELLLGGLTSKYAHLSYSFWSYMFKVYFRNKLIKTTISCSNIGVVNLYKKFGFYISKHMLGFHLHI